MSKNAKLEKLWQQIGMVERALQAEAAKSKGEVTEHFRNLKKDMVKLKAEYDKVRGYSLDPHNADQMESWSRQRVMNRLTGKEGPDSHGI